MTIGQTEVTMQLYSIASGSSGNCIYAGKEDEGILFDVGISMKKVRGAPQGSNPCLCNGRDGSRHMGKG